MWRESIVEGLLLSSSGTVRFNGCHEKSKNSRAGEAGRGGRWNLLRPGVQWGENRRVVRQVISRHRRHDA